VGAVIHIAPTQVRIWFDGELEPAFSRLTVTGRDGKAVDLGDGRVDPQGRRLLRVTLPVLSPGTYRVRWSVVAVDGHRTEGDYSFTLAPPE
jgi:methionine-rich copper-binding protein CopC